MQTFTVFQQTIIRNVLNLFFHNATVEKKLFLLFLFA